MSISGTVLIIDHMLLLRLLYGIISQPRRRLKLLDRNTFRFQLASDACLLPIVRMSQILRLLFSLPISGTVPSIASSGHNYLISSKALVGVVYYHLRRMLYLRRKAAEVIVHFWEHGGIVISNNRCR